MKAALAKALAQAERDLLDMVADTEAEVGEDYNFSDLVEAAAIGYPAEVKKELERRHLGWHLEEGDNDV